MSINREQKYFDLSHLQELADVLIPVVEVTRGSGLMEYIKTHHVTPIDKKED